MLNFIKNFFGRFRAGPKNYGGQDINEYLAAIYPYTSRGRHDR